MIRLLALAFLLSGFSALVYETAWTRLLLGVFGSTAPAAATVLAAFMGGLALGAWGGGRLADRRGPREALRLYVGAEAVVAVFAFLSPSLLGGLDATLVAAEHALGSGVAGRALLVGLVLLLPTLLLGATLPVAVRAASAAPGASVVRSTSVLYAVNTAGAVLGALVAGFLLLPALGIGGTIRAGAVLTVLAAAVGWLALRDIEAGQEPDRDRERVPVTTSLLVAAAVAGLSGMGALASEVLWTRALALAMGSTSHAFATMLGIFLLGIAGGAALAPRLLARARSPARLLGILQAALAVLSLVALGIGARLPWLFLWLHETLPQSWAAELVSRFFLAAALLLLPTLLLGATLPATVALARGAADASPVRSGRDVGLVYATNGVGAVLGALLAGLVLMPRLGMEGAATAVGCVHLAAMLVALFSGGGTTTFRVSVAVLAACAFLVASSGQSPWDPRVVARGFFFFPRLFVQANEAGSVETLVGRSEVVFYRDGSSASILVLRDRSTLGFLVDGKPEATTVPRDMRNQYFLGHLPALMHRGPVRHGLVVGLGSGMTAGCLSMHADHVTVVELTPEVVEAASHFADWNHGVLGRRSVRVRNDDARHFLRATRERYDVITSDPIHPYVRGSESLYSLDYFRRVKARLAPGGVVAQWLPLYQMGLDDVQTVVATFREVFPDATLWLTITDAILLGGTGNRLRPAREIGLDASRPEMNESLRRVYASDPPMLLAARIAGPRGLARFSRAARVSTDDRPVLEFRTPRHVHEQTVSTNLRSLLAIADDPHWDLSGIPDEIRHDLARARDAMRDEVRGIAYMEEVKDDRALERFHAAYKTYPRALASRSLASGIYVARALEASSRHDRGAAALALHAAYEAYPASCDALRGLYELARATNDRELGRRMVREAEGAGCVDRQ